VAVRRRLQAEVHQLAAAGQMVQHVGDVDMPLVREVRHSSGEKSVDHVAVEAFHPQRLDRALHFAAGGEVGGG
jgi:hypothetical protein